MAPRVRAAVPTRGAAAGGRGAPPRGLASMRLMLAASYWRAGQRAAAVRNGAVAVAWRPGVARRLVCARSWQRARRGELGDDGRGAARGRSQRRTHCARSAARAHAQLAVPVPVRRRGGGGARTRPELRAEYALSSALGSAIWMLVNLSLPEAAGRLLARRERPWRRSRACSYAASLVLGALGMALVFAIGFAARGSLLEHASTSAIVLAAADRPAHASCSRSASASSPVSERPAPTAGAAP